MAKLEVIGKVYDTKIEVYNLSYLTWSEDEIKELQNNYSYHSNHKKEAEDKFHRKWSVIRAKAFKLGIPLIKMTNKKLELSQTKINNQWTDEQLKELEERYFYYLEHKDEAEEYFKKSWCSIANKSSLLKITSFKKNRNCGMYLGCNVAERILGHVFKEVQRMSIKNKGFDFICNKGYKIDSKASCLRKNNTYGFHIKYNKIADYFLLIGFDNRNDLNPKHIWLIKSDEVIRRYRKLNDFETLTILNNSNDLSKFSKYELADKLKKTIECCDELKNKF